MKKRQLLILGIIEIPIESTTPEILEDMERIKDEIGKNQYLMSA